MAVIVFHSCRFRHDLVAFATTTSRIIVVTSITSIVARGTLTIAKAKARIVNLFNSGALFLVAATPHFHQEAGVHSEIAEGSWQQGLRLPQAFHVCD